MLSRGVGIKIRGVSMMIKGLMTCCEGVFYICRVSIGLGYAWTSFGDVGHVLEELSCISNGRRLQTSYELR